MKSRKFLKKVLIGSALLTAISAAFAFGLGAHNPAAMAFASAHVDEAVLQASEFLGGKPEAASMAIAALAVMAVIVKRRGKGDNA